MRQSGAAGADSILKCDFLLLSESYALEDGSWEFATLTSSLEETELRPGGTNDASAPKCLCRVPYLPSGHKEFCEGRRAMAHAPNCTPQDGMMTQRHPPLLHLGYSAEDSARAEKVALLSVRNTYHLLTTSPKS
jgi:hypothetical protein